MTIKTTKAGKSRSRCQQTNRKQTISEERNSNLTDGSQLSPKKKIENFCNLNHLIQKMDFFVRSVLVWEWSLTKSTKLDFSTWHVLIYWTIMTKFNQFPLWLFNCCRLFISLLTSGILENQICKLNSQGFQNQNKQKTCGLTNAQILRRNQKTMF